MMPAAAGPSRVRFLAQVGGDGTTAGRWGITGDVWIDGDGALPRALRWVRGVAAHGAVAGALHGVLAGLVSFLVGGGVGGGGPVGEVLVMFGTFGLAVGLAFGLAIGLLTVPVVLTADRVDAWSRLRLPIVAVPAVAMVVLALVLVPFWPRDPDGGRSLGSLVETLVWFHAGPACWVAASMRRLTRRWQARSPIASRGRAVPPGHHAG